MTVCNGEFSLGVDRYPKPSGVLYLEISDTGVNICLGVKSLKADCLDEFREDKLLALPIGETGDDRLSLFDDINARILELPGVGVDTRGVRSLRPDCLNECLGDKLLALPAGELGVDWLSLFDGINTLDDLVELTGVTLLLGLDPGETIGEAVTLEGGRSSSSS